MEIKLNEVKNIKDFKFNEYGYVDKSDIFDNNFKEEVLNFMKKNINK